MDLKKELVYAFNKLNKKTNISENDINKSLYTKNIQIPNSLYEREILKDLVIFFFGRLHILRYSSKKNYGQILRLKI